MALLSPRNLTGARFRPGGARKQSSRRLECEALEPRYLLTASPFYDFAPELHEGDALQVSQICVSKAEARVRLEAADLSGSLVTQVEVNQQFYLQAYVRDTRNGIPKGVVMATVDVAYDPSRLSVTGTIEHGERFSDFRTGRTNQPGLIQNAGGSLWNANWTDKDEPGAEDLLFQVLFTATSPGSVEILTGRSQGIMLRSVNQLVPERDIEYGRLALTIGSDGDDGGREDTRSEADTQNGPLCQPGPDVRVRLQAVNLSGNPVTQLDVGEPFYLQAYVRDTRNGIPKGVVMATVDVAYDPSRLSMTGRIEHGERFPDFRTGRMNQPGLIQNAGGSLWNANWTDKDEPGAEDLLFQVLFTATSPGSVEFLTGRSQGIMLRSVNQLVPERDIEYGRLALTIGSDGDDGGREDARHEVEAQNDPLCQPGPEVRVRLQAVDLSGNPVTQVDVGKPFYLQAYVRDTRNGIPKGVVMATVDVAYDPSRLSMTGKIEQGERFPDFRTGRMNQPGLIQNAGGSLWNANWTDKDEPGAEDLLFQVLFTATSPGSVEFLTGRSQGIMLRSVNQLVPERDIEYGRLALTIGSDGDDGAREDGRHEVEAQNDPLCQPGPEVRVRLQAVDLSGNPVTQVDVGELFYLQAYVRDTRNGIPKGVVMATVDVAYDPSRVSMTGRIEQGERFPDFRTGRMNQPGLIQNAGGSLWNANWTDKDEPGAEDLLFQVLFTATSPGSVEFLTGRSQGIMLRSVNQLVPERDIEYGRLALTIGGDGDDYGQIDEPGAFSDSIEPLGGGEFAPVVPTTLATSSPTVVAAQNTASLATSSPSAVTDSGAMVQRQDEVLSVWTTPILEDGLVDVLASFSPIAVDDGAAGSLREAIAVAAINGQADEIRLGSGVYRLDLAADGDLDISESGLAVKIVGAGRGQTVIDATGLGDRAFHVWEGALLELEGLTILAGEVNDDGAGIRNAGTLTLRDVEIAGGTANGDGGGIFNSGTAQLESVRLVGNVALRGGGLANGPGAQLVGDELEVLSNTAFWPPEYKKNFNGAFGVGGGVMNWGHMELSRVQVISNQSDNFGGGIQNDRFLVMNHALLAENTAPVGSAIYSFRESPSLGSTPAETVLDDITLRGNTSAWDRDPVEQWYDTTVSATNVVEVDGEAGFLAREAALTVLEDSSENSLPLGALGWNVPITAALTRSGATATVSDGELVFSPQPDFCGLDLVVVVDANGVPHPIDVWVEPQNDPFMIDFPESIQVFAWEQAYLDPPFENLTKAPYEVRIPVLENASYAPDIGERLTITSVSASHGGTVGIWDPNELTSREPESWPDDRAWINYSPAAGFSGVETITYTMSDGNGAVSEFTVQAHVEDRDDVMQFRLEARNRAGEVVDRVRQGEMIDVYVYVTSGLDETAIRSADAEIRYHSSQVERVGDVQFGDALPDLQWWGDTKSSGIPDLRTLGMKANGGFNVFDDPHQDLILAQFSLQVVGNQMVELAFDAKDCTGNLYDLGPAATIPYAAIEFVGLSLPVVTGWHNAEMPPDVDGNQSVVPLDALILVNELNRGGSRLLSEPVEGEGEGDGDTHHRHHRYFDVNNDGYLTPLDLVRVVNVLNSPVTRAEGEAGVNLASGVTAAWEPNAATRNTGSPAAFPPSAATDGGATVQRQDEVFSGWSTPILEDGLVDVLASGDRTRRTDADQEMKGDTDLLSADALLANAMDDAWDL